MHPRKLYFSEAYRGPIEPSGCSAEQAETREEYLARTSKEDKALEDRQRSYRAKAIDKAWKAEKALEAKRHAIMVLEICDYAVAHGWPQDQLSDLLEPGESLPAQWDPDRDLVAESGLRAGK